MRKLLLTAALTLWVSPSHATESIDCTFMGEGHMKFMHDAGDKHDVAMVDGDGGLYTGRYTVLGNTMTVHESNGTTWRIAPHNSKVMIKGQWYPMFCR